MKTEITYNSSGTGDTDEPGGAPQPLPKLLVDEIEVLSAGSIGRNTSYYLEQYIVDDGLPGQPRDMWVNFDKYARADDPIGPAFHAKFGQFTLPLPVDPETQRPTLSGYLLYSQVVASNAFNFFNPEIGSDLSYTDDRHGFEAHFDTLEAYTRGSGIPISGLDFMATASKTIGNDVTAYVYRYQGQQNFSPVVDNFHRQAYGLGYEKGKFSSVGIIQTGNDSSAYGSATVRCRRADSCRPVAVQQRSRALRPLRQRLRPIQPAHVSGYARPRDSSGRSRAPDVRRHLFRKAIPARARPALRFLRDVTT